MVTQPDLYHGVHNDGTFDCVVHVNHDTEVTFYRRLSTPVNDIRTLMQKATRDYVKVMKLSVVNTSADEIEEWREEKDALQEMRKPIEMINFDEIDLTDRQP